MNENFGHLRNMHFVLKIQQYIPMSCGSDVKRSVLCWQLVVIKLRTEIQFNGNFTTPSSFKNGKTSVNNNNVPKEKWIFCISNDL